MTPKEEIHALHEMLFDVMNQMVLVLQHAEGLSAELRDQSVIRYHKALKLWLNTDKPEKPKDVPTPTEADLAEDGYLEFGTEVCFCSFREAQLALVPTWDVLTERWYGEDVYVVQFIHCSSGARPSDLDVKSVNGIAARFGLKVYAGPIKYKGHWTMAYHPDPEAGRLSVRHTVDAAPGQPNANGNLYPQPPAADARADDPKSLHQHMFGNLTGKHVHRLRGFCLVAQTMPNVLGAFLRDGTAVVRFAARRDEPMPDEAYLRAVSELAAACGLEAGGLRINAGNWAMAYSPGVAKETEAARLERFCSLVRFRPFIHGADRNNDLAVVSFMEPCNGKYPSRKTVDMVDELAKGSNLTRVTGFMPYNEHWGCGYADRQRAEAAKAAEAAREQEVKEELKVEAANDEDLKNFVGELLFLGGITEVHVHDGEVSVGFGCGDSAMDKFGGKVREAANVYGFMTVVPRTRWSEWQMSFQRAPEKPQPQPQEEAKA